MTTKTVQGTFPKVAMTLLALLLTPASAVVFGQEQTPPPYDQQGGPPPDNQYGAAAPQNQPMAPEQLESLLAPIALYPDPLLSQVLVASTYPLEIVEADQWIRQNGNLRGQDLMSAAQQQSWDPSVQALVAFPDVIARLAQDVHWTTDVGNAFLAQQADVMSAVQRLRAQARDSGRLRSTPQESVNVQDQNGEEAINIQPADPQYMYVPNYNPAYFWGDAYDYPPLYYPGVGVGWGFGYGVPLSLYFGGGWGGWGGWGWGPNWFGGTVFVNAGFFHRYRFAEWRGASFGHSVWFHNPGHRLGVPYGSTVVAAHYGGGTGMARGFTGRPGAPVSGARTYGPPASQRSYGAAQAPSAAQYQRFRTMPQRETYRAVPQQTYQYHSNNAPSYPAARPSYSGGSSYRPAPAPAAHVSAPRAAAPSGGGSHPSGGGGGGGGSHASGGHR